MRKTIENSDITNHIPENKELSKQQLISELQNAPETLGNGLNIATEKMMKERGDTIKKTRSKIKITGFELQTSNDNLNLKQGLFVGPDDGHTFGIGGKISLEYNEKPIDISAGIDSYTSNPDILIRETGERGKMGWIDQSKPHTGERQDRAFLSVDTKKNIYNKNNLSVEFGYGGKITYDGDVGGQTIQNTWHESGAAKYNVYAPYEKNTGFGANVNLGLDAKKFLNEHIYLGVSAKGSINFLSHGNTKGEVAGYAGVKYKYFEAEAGMRYRFTANESSPTIAIAQTPQNGTYGYVRGAVGLENTKLFYEVSGEDGGLGSVGINFKF